MADIVDELGEALAPSNAAYALFRLGCLFSFMSTQRKQGVHCPSTPCAGFTGLHARRADKLRQDQLVAETAACWGVEGRDTFRLVGMRTHLPYWVLTCHAGCAALEASGVVRRLLGLAQAKIGALTAGDATFLLDGCARLGLRPAPAFLDALAAQASLAAPHV